MNCRGCGSALAAEAIFCPRCGARVPAGAGPGDPSHLVGRPAAITFLAVLDFLGGGLFLLGALVCFLLVRQSSFFAVAGTVLGVIGAASLAGGLGLWRLRPFGRITQLILSWVGLLAFPFGTIVNPVILVYLHKAGIRVLFAGKPLEQLTPKEIGSLREARSTGMLAVVIAVVAIGLVGVMWLGIISAIAVPNLLGAIDRGKQKRTMADLRSIATAVESYATDHKAYPMARDIEELAAVLQPVYIRTLPTRDGWGRRIVYESAASEGAAYRIVSFGKDGVAGPAQSATQTGEYAADIIWSNGEFVQWPAGVQK